MDHARARRQWWGYKPSPLAVCEIDLRPGGTWRFAARDADGTELAWRGTYVEVERPFRPVSTELFEGAPDAIAQNTLTLTELDGVTELAIMVLHATQEARDSHFASGIDAGMGHSLDRVDDLLFELPGGTDDVVDVGASPGEVSQRYRRVADLFTNRTNEVTGDAWENPSPCDGWVARDVVRHLVEWIPAFLAADTAASTITHPHAGTHRLDDAIAMFFLGDILVHTWDLARSAGLVETLDPDVTHDMLIGLEPLDEALRASGQYGPKVAVPETADEQTKLPAFTGRAP